MPNLERLIGRFRAFAEVGFFAPGAWVERLIGGNYVPRTRETTRLSCWYSMTYFQVRRASLFLRCGLRASVIPDHQAESVWNVFKNGNGASVARSLCYDSEIRNWPTDRGGSARVLSGSFPSLQVRSVRKPSFGDPEL